VEKLSEMKYSNWWKILGVLIIIYVIIAGFVVPLNPGIVKVSPANATVAELVQLEVRTYNTSYDVESESIRSWLKLDGEFAIESMKVQVRDRRNLVIYFDVPPFLPLDSRITDAVLIVDHPVSGMAILPSAVFIKQDSVNAEAGRRYWSADIRDLSVGSGFKFPFRNILKETIRNTYFHVAIWFAMFILLIGSVIYSVKFLRTNKPDHDMVAAGLVTVGILFGILGVATGSLWAKNTWGTYWTNDTKLNMTAVSLLIYMAYLVLRQAIPDEEQKARVTSIYNVFAFVAMIPLLFVIPRLNDSLHPGSGGNPALGGEDLDHTMRMVFYPAIIGYTLLGLWITEIYVRIKRLQYRNDHTD